MSININVPLGVMSGLILITSFAPQKPSAQASEQSNLAGFDRAYTFVRKWEGGNTDHPNDVGGRTGKGGILQPEYDKFREGKGLQKQDVFQISEEEIKEIYQDYWNQFECSKYANPLSIVCLDSYINFNPETAKSFFDNLPADSKQAAIEVGKRRLEFRDKRVAENSSQSVFLAGWKNRDNALINEVSK
jgi:lysozyme family protein